MHKEISIEFIKNLPKVELHSHLNGSLKSESILELGRELYGENTPDFINITQSFTDFNGLDLQACFQKFKFVHDLTKTEKGLRLATQMVIRDFASDHVIYLELRTTPKSNDNMSKRTYIETVVNAINSAEEVLTGKIIIKLLLSIDRSKPISEATEMLNLAIELRQNSKHLITGIDLSGNPRYGSFQELKPLLERARVNGLKLALHCAEIDNPIEIEEMLSFGMDRCGHGTFLSKSQIMDLAKRNVAVECCLSSNVKCATVPSYTDHHFKHILKHGICGENRILVLCTDDCGVFDTTLSNELDIAARTFELHKRDLIQLQLNAVAHAFTTDEEKTSLKDKISDYANGQRINQS